MKIAFITFQYPPFVQGGAGTYAYNLTRELARLGHEVHVFSPRVAWCAKESVEEGLSVHRLCFLNKPFLAAPSFWFSLRKDFPSLERQAGGFDIVHSNGPIDLSLSRKVVSSPRVITLHHLTQTTLKVLKPSLFSRVKNLRGEIGIAPFIEQICMKRADRIAADSEFTKRDIVKTYGTPETSIGIIYLGVNPEDYYRAQRWWLTTRCHVYIVSDKAMKVRMPHCELKWEIPIDMLWGGGKFGGGRELLVKNQE